MSLHESLALTAELANPESLSTFQSHLEPKWIEQALQATGTASLRKRRLPAEQVLWLVLGIALFRDRSILDLVDKLDLVLPSPQDEPPLSSSAITQARQRLGPEPLKWLFEYTAAHWTLPAARRHAWKGLVVYGLDGSTFCTPDTPENAKFFGYPNTRHGLAALPQLRLVALMDLNSHMLAAVNMGPYCDGEYTLSEGIWHALPDDSLTILDKNFLSAALLSQLAQSGQNRNWLIRAKSNTRWEILDTLGPDDHLVEMKVSHQARKTHANLGRTWRARAVGYQREGKQFWLLTSLEDPDKYPAQEVVQMYAQRWEIEQGYDEIKTEMLESQITLRSKSPKAIEQEFWGVMLTYNLVRLEIERIAREAEVKPYRISFVMALRLIQDEWLWCAIASPGSIPKKLKRLREKVKRFILPERRARSYRREVRVNQKPYPRKFTHSST